MFCGIFSKMLFFLFQNLINLKNIDIGGRLITGVERAQEPNLTGTCTHL